MTTSRARTTPLFAAALLAILVAACSQAPGPTGPDGDATGDTSFIGRQAARAIEAAGAKLKAENIPIGEGQAISINGRSYGTGSTPSGLPKAEITPDGQLLLDGEPVETTPAQRAALLDYRHGIEGLALAGMAIGVQGADIAGTALTGIGQALFGGEEGRRAYEARIEAEAAKIKREALGLCDLLPPLYDSQQALADALPEFAPYATMTPAAADACRKDLEDDGDAPVDAGLRA